MPHRTPDHGAEMAARAQRRAARSQRTWADGPTPGRAKERPTTTTPEALAKIKANKAKQDRKRAARLAAAANGGWRR